MLGTKVERALAETEKFVGKQGSHLLYSGQQLLVNSFPGAAYVLRQLVLRLVPAKSATPTPLLLQPLKKLLVYCFGNIDWMGQDQVWLAESDGKGDPETTYSRFEYKADSVNVLNLDPKEEPGNRVSFLLHLNLPPFCVIVVHSGSSDASDGGACGH
jgi:hypothetical protein